MSVAAVSAMRQCIADVWCAARGEQHVAPTLLGDVPKQLIPHVDGEGDRLLSQGGHAVAQADAVGASGGCHQ